MTNNVTVGDFIKSKRKEKGLTLEQVGAYVGVSKGTVSRWESNEIGNMRTHRVKLLCECLGISTIEFLECCTTVDKIKEFEKLTKKEFLEEIMILLERTDIDKNERKLLLQTLDFICSKD